jgi:transposase-like protein
VNESAPNTLVQAVRFFSDPDTTVAYVAKLRWPDGPICPACEGREHSYLTTRRVWKCKSCKKQFSVKIGTIFEDSAIPLDKWMVAIWLIANSKNGISSHELGRSLGVTQKSAWFMNHRIRLAMQTGSFDRFGGHVEVDETYIGGKARNMHVHVRKRKIRGTGLSGKTIVAGVLERGGNISAAVIPDTSRATLHAHIEQRVQKSAAVYTDKLPSYNGLTGLTGLGYAHATIDHAEKYVDGQIHTNGLENFWSLLKRGLAGTYVSVEPFHLFRYLDERLFTFNERALTDLQRFHKVLSSVAGRRLTYAELTAKSSAS